MNRIRKAFAVILMLGAALYLFTDVGLLADQWKDLDLDALKYDTGIGFTWIIRKDSTLRIEIALSPKFRFIVGSGWKF